MQKTKERWITIFLMIFFSLKWKREYLRSIELEDVVLDIDKEGYITGIQIFGASKMFNIDKRAIRSIKKWVFKVRTEGKGIFIQLMFEMVRRNKVVERGQNLVRESSSLGTDSEVMCAVSA